MFPTQPQIQQQAPRSGEIQKYKDKMEEIKRLQSGDTLLDGGISINNNNNDDLLNIDYDVDDSNNDDHHNSKNNNNSTLLSSQQQLQLSTTTITASTIKQKIVEDIIEDNNNSFSKQITDSHTVSMIGSNNSGSPKSSPNVTAELNSVDGNHSDNSNNTVLASSINEKNSNDSNNKNGTTDIDHNDTIELSDSIEDSDYNSWFYGLYDSNIHNTYFDNIYSIYPLLGGTLCQLDDRVGSILVCLGECRVEETNSTEKAEEFVNMIFNEIESVKTEKEIEELNKKYVPRFNIEHNDGMNLYDLYRMYHGDVPLLKAKCIIPYYPDDESFEKKLLYRVLPEVMKKGVIDSLEKYFYGIFELSAQARIGKIRESIKQNKELDNLKGALYEYLSRENANIGVEK